MSVLTEILKAKLLPIIQMNDVAAVDLLAQSLIKGGLPIAEVTLRSDNAIEVIRKFSVHKNLCVGAGTVSNVSQVDDAVDAGAAFIISPGLNPKVVNYCMQIEIPIFPGVCTPTDIEMALDLGLDTLKFFPAEAAGGTKMIKALSGPYGQVKFIPTGGISETNISDYMALTNVVACGGSWMVKPDLISGHKFDEITELTRNAVSLIR